MNTAMCESKLQKRMIFSNVINSIYLLLFGIMAFGTWKLYQDCEALGQALLDNAGNIDGESFLAGYEVIGNLAGAGTISLFSAGLYLGFIISAAYALVFLAENICGYVVYAKFKQVESGEKMKNAVKVDAVIKCILAMLVIVPACFLLFTDQWLSALVAILPQTAVLVLSIMVIRLLPKRQKGAWTEEVG